MRLEDNKLWITIFVLKSFSASGALQTALLMCATEEVATVNITDSILVAAAIFARAAIEHQKSS